MPHPKVLSELSVLVEKSVWVFFALENLTLLVFKNSAWLCHCVNWKLHVISCCRDGKFQGAVATNVSPSIELHKGGKKRTETRMGC